MPNTPAACSCVPSYLGLAAVSVVSGVVSYALIRWFFGGRS
jgi:hypothetical protein